MAGADELGEQAVVAALVSDSARDDCGMYAEILGEGHDVEWGRVAVCVAVFPCGVGYQSFFGESVGLGFFGVLAGDLAAPQIVVVNKYVAFGVNQRVVSGVYVQGYVRDFVKQAEPEVVYAVVSQGERDDRTAVGGAQGRAVQRSAGQMGQYYEWYSMFGQQLFGKPWAVL